MSDVFPAKFTKLIPLQTIRIVLLIFTGRIISLFADRTGQVDDVSHVFLPQSVFRETRKVTTSALVTSDA
jgi:hypothetical protein